MVALAQRWGVACRLTTSAGDDIAFQVIFQRHQPAPSAESVAAGHAVACSQVDFRRGTRVTHSWVDGAAVEAFRVLVARNTAADAHVRSALLEALSCGDPIAPDKLLTGSTNVSPDCLELKFGEVGTLRELDDGSVRLAMSTGDRCYDLVLTPGAPLTDHVVGCTVRGYISGDESLAVNGCGWYENHPAFPMWPQDTGRQQLILLLDNGWTLAASTSVATSGRALVTVSGPDGRMNQIDADLYESAPWTSLATLNTYPTRWRLRGLEFDLDVELVGAFADQEIRTMATGGGQLSGAGRVTGVMAGKAVSGWATLEVVVPQQVCAMEEFLGRLRSVTRSQVQRLYPDRPSVALTASLLGGGGAAEPQGLPDDVVHETLVRPIRHLTDAAGRGWRTYVCSASIELLGVSSEPYVPLMAAAEIIHSGNLAIDDVQDGSSWRRGVPAVHEVYGVAATINAATAAYFALDRVIDEILPEDDRMRLRVYQIYVRTLRAAHGGQAMDLFGHTEAMDQAVVTRDPGPLLRRVVATHRFKSGVPARGFAEIGAVIAGADPLLTTAMGDYFEAVGTAYQITDDLLDLLGATGTPTPVGTKHRGEDLRTGKVTMPLARTVCLLPTDRMSALWKSVRDGGAGDEIVHEVACAVVESGAVEACYRQAEALVNDTWHRLEPLLPGSMTKVMVRALGFYAARRKPAGSCEVSPCN